MNRELPFDQAESYLSETWTRCNEITQEYADNVRRYIIIPFCERHKLKFWSGMGTWFYELPTGKNVYALDFDRFSDEIEFVRNIRKIDELLMQDIPTAGCLGYMVSDVGTPNAPD